MEKQNSAISGGDDSKPNYKVKLMCSYGGKIQPRPHDHQLAYAGGDTKILAVDRRIKFPDIVAKLISLSNAAVDISSFKYQLPGEDLDALVSVINDDDLEHMMSEYDRISTVSSKPARLRVFIFSPNRPSSAPLNPDFLFGFDKEDDYDYQTRSIAASEIHPGSGTNRPDSAGLDPRNGAEIQPQIQGVTFTQGTFSRENHVTGGSYAGGVQLVYQTPAVAHGYGVPVVRVVPGIVYREQLVYDFSPAMVTAPEEIRRGMMNGVGLEERGIAHVAADGGGRSEGYSGVGVVSPHQIGDAKNDF